MPAEHDGAARAHGPATGPNVRGPKVRGLTGAQVQALRDRYGWNETPERRTGFVRGTLKRMWDPVSWLLEAAMVFEFVLGKGPQALFVLLLLLFSAITGQLQATRSSRAIGFLHRRLHISARTLRDGRWGVLASRELVPGDVVRVGAGDIVPADLRIDDGAVSVDESAVTGEPADVTRTVGAALAASTTAGHGEAIGTVTATGTRSSYGRTVELVRSSDPPGGLQKLLFTIVRYLACLDVALAVVLIVAAVIRGEPWKDLLPFVVILFIATIPISMPSSFTVANSLEASALARGGALVVGLTGIQEAATMDVLLVDKTGTLTTDRPQVGDLLGFGGVSGAQALRLALAATDESATDTVSAAITAAGREQDLGPLRRTAFSGFDPVAKISRARVLPEDGPQEWSVVLGSPAVVATMAAAPARYGEHVDALAAGGARVLAVAAGHEDRMEIKGLIAVADSPRPDAADVVRHIGDRGVRIIMITGDSAAAGRAIAGRVGLGGRVGAGPRALRRPWDFDVIAEVFPADKHAVVRALQQAGHVVGMTGDGINDAPALAQADVGIAVGEATDVARRAARIVLTGEGLGGVGDVIDSSHRVYRRMMTWTITKLARTAELAGLLTFGYLFAGFFPVPLSLIVLIVILNDLVTLTLGTDRADGSGAPERWDMPRLARSSAVFAVGWLVTGLALLWYYQRVAGLDAGRTGSLLFAFLIYSAMATILMTRTRGPLWRSAPSRWVAGVVAGNLVLASVLAIAGVATAAVPATSVVWLLGVTAAATLILDAIKVRMYRHEGRAGLPRRRGQGGRTQAPGAPEAQGGRSSGTGMIP